MREIVFDTETTGISWQEGHRVIEIGALEVFNRVPTGKAFHKYINPEREIEQEAINVHGITNEFVADKPLFADIAQEFLDFIADSPLVAHNASFDMGFLNYEYDLLEKPALSNEVVDTLQIARKKFPGARASLDALCQRYEVDSSARTYHGALLDAELLAAVYLELTGGRQPDFMGSLAAQSAADAQNAYKKTQAQAVRFFPPTDAEIEAHKAFCDKHLNGGLWYPKAEEGE